MEPMEVNFFDFFFFFFFQIINLNNNKLFKLLSLLIERFNYPTPKNASDEELEYFKYFFHSLIRKFSFFFLKKKKNQIKIRQSIRRPVQLRVFNVAKNWVDKHYLDFQESKELLKKFLEFIKDDMTNVEDMDKAAASLTKAIRKKVFFFSNFLSFPEFH